MGSMWKVQRKKRRRSLTPSGKAGLEFLGQRELSLSYRVPAQEQASENVIEVEMLFFFCFSPLPPLVPPHMCCHGGEAKHPQDKLSSGCSKIPSALKAGKTGAVLGRPLKSAKDYLRDR